MNYEKIYDELIFRAKSRILKEYTEKHHIIPVCMGGSDDKSNLVQLTPEEHYIAHQLLVKIHPNNGALIKSAIMMCTGRPSNKIYGWLRRKFVLIQSASQSGSMNSQFGTKWIYNDKIKQSVKIPKTNSVPSGWKLGRKVSNWDSTRICKFCKNTFIFEGQEKYCSSECKNKATNVFYGREDEFLKQYGIHKSMNKALKEMGYPGAISHWYKWAKKVLDSTIE